MSPLGACTIGPDSTGERCGEPGVVSFVGSGGETFVECARHAPRYALGPATGLTRERAVKRLGDPVVIERHGKSYLGYVSKIGKRGAVYADVRYGNGAARTVRV
jgi:hypothetical protein